MVDGKIFGQGDIDGDFLRAAAFGGRNDVQDLRADEAAEEFEGVLFEELLFRGRLVAVVDDLFQCGATVLVGAGEDVEQRVMVDGEAGNERLGRCGLEFFVGLFIPVDEAFFRWLAFLEGLLFVNCGFGGESEVLDDVLGRLGDDVADGVEPTAKRMLRIMAENYRGGPVGMSTIAVAVGEEVATSSGLSASLEIHPPTGELRSSVRRSGTDRVPGARGGSSTPR